MEILEKRIFPGLAGLYLARLAGNPSRPVEFVDTLEPGIPKAEKWVMMISTQFGCPVGCAMCDAGSMGYGGNLSAEDMLAQIRRIVDDNPALDAGRHPKLKIHFARMGEPSLNPAVLDALRMLAMEFPFPGVMPSLSTTAPKSPAIAPFFEELLNVKDGFYGGGRFQLQFSVHSTDEAERRRIMPVKALGLEEIAAYGERFVGSGDRKITLNFALAGDRGIDPERLAAIFSPTKFLIKITPVNPTRTAAKNGIGPAWQDIPTPLKAGVDALREAGFSVIVSPSLPEEIGAATSCGQLWSEELAGKSGVALANREREIASYITPDNLDRKAGAWIRSLQRRSRPETPLRTDRAGLLIVDMQQLFLDSWGRSYLPPARVILPRVRELAEGFRRAGRPVYFAFHAHEDAAKDGGLMASWWRHVCMAGSPEAKIAPVLAPEPARSFRKCRYNAFTNPDLEAALQRDGVEEIVLAGVATNLCIESTARDAFDRGFKTFIAADATAARTEEMHLSSLKNLAHGFSAVLLSSAMLDRLMRNHPNPLPLGR